MFNSISKHVMAGYAAVLVLLLATSLLLFRTSEQIKESNNQFIDSTLPTLDAVKRIETMIGDMQISAFGIYGLTVTLDEFVEQWRAQQQLISQDLELLELQQMNTGQLAQSVAAVIEPIGSLYDVMAARSRDWDQARTELARITLRIDELNLILADLQRQTASNAEQDSLLVSSRLVDMQQLIAITLLLSVLITGWAYWMARRRIVAPVSQLASELDKITASSDLTSTVDTSGSREVANTATSVNTLLATFHQIAVDIQHSSLQLGSSAEQLSGSALATDDQIIQFTAQIEHLIHTIEQIEGNITQSSDRSMSASEIALVGAKQVNDGAQQVTENAASISKLADQIEESATMLISLKQAGDQVSSVVETIAQIAEQTNLLALNAAIEAARAGDSGRGFAVVADEVRTLASRTYESTHEINSILETIVSAISTTVAAMDHNKSAAQQTVVQTQSTVQALEQLQQTVVQLSDENKILAQLSEQSSVSATTMREHIEAISEGSEAVSVASKETKEASGNLSSLANSLNLSVAKFRV
ncbi:methyl-accepting chemotaxis protein [Neiella marina]|uniref:Methyl-accepting chemotaxis protein n=1 Tax=Neiella holothuriorum TaxID=2870530 RepID=A0ABS7EKR2_9GAMM|nr:methyl-accepting chemotaxis protein [Neiella holothuriorum]MBW8192794.1 methyl-accepting chemotaxis protein [Neiella holothuriorum]